MGRPLALMCLEGASLLRDLRDKKKGRSQSAQNNRERGDQGPKWASLAVDLA